jgi:hypothetical protein
MGHSWNDSDGANLKFSEKKPGDKVVISPHGLIWDRARKRACNVSRDTVEGGAQQRCQKSMSHKEKIRRDI